MQVIEVAASCYYPPSSSKSIYPIHFQDAINFVGDNETQFKGDVDFDFAHLTQALFDEKALELEAKATTIEHSPKATGKRQAARITKFSRPCSLSIIIYGPMDLFEEVGSFLEERDIFLQDPVGCKRNVPYCNPHRLPLDGAPPKMTADLEKPSLLSVVAEDIDTRPELLDTLNSQQDLAETEQPRSIRTSLAR